MYTEGVQVSCKKNVAASSKNEFILSFSSGFLQQFQEIFFAVNFGIRLRVNVKSERIQTGKRLVFYNRHPGSKISFPASAKYHPHGFYSHLKTVCSPSRKWQY